MTGSVFISGHEFLILGGAAWSLDRAEGVQRRGVRCIPSPSPRCDCPPCPGRGNDGHRMTHCAECCFGTGVEADLDCPTHGMPTSPRPYVEPQHGGRGTNQRRPQ